MSDFKQIDVPHGYAVYKKPYDLIGVGETLKEARGDWNKQHRRREGARTCETIRKIMRRNKPCQPYLWPATRN